MFFDTIITLLAKSITSTIASVKIKCSKWLKKIVGHLYQIANLCPFKSKIIFISLYTDITK